MKTIQSLARLAKDRQEKRGEEHGKLQINAADLGQFRHLLDQQMNKILKVSDFLSQGRESEQAFKSKLKMQKVLVNDSGLSERRESQLKNGKVTEATVRPADRVSEESGDDDFERTHRDAELEESDQEGNQPAKPEQTVN